MLLVRICPLVLSLVIWLLYLDVAVHSARILTRTTGRLRTKIPKRSLRTKTKSKGYPHPGGLTQRTFSSIIDIARKDKSRIDNEGLSLDVIRGKIERLEKRLRRRLDRIESLIKTIQRRSSHRTDKETAGEGTDETFNEREFKMQSETDVNYEELLQELFHFLVEAGLEPDSLRPKLGAPPAEQILKLLDRAVRNLKGLGILEDVSSKVVLIHKFLSTLASASQQSPRPEITD